MGLVDLFVRICGFVRLSRRRRLPSPGGANAFAPVKAAKCSVQEEGKKAQEPWEFVKPSGLLLDQAVICQRAPRHSQAEAKKDTLECKAAAPKFVVDVLLKLPEV
jgi:hypothetical protein